MKPISGFWALLVGLLSVVVQIVTYYLRFGQLNSEASLASYVLFILAGTIGGAILIFFLNCQTSVRGRQILFAAFLLASPIALLMMLAGGLLGWLGILILPQIPWALFTWLGSLLSRAFS